MSAHTVSKPIRRFRFEQEGSGINISLVQLGPADAAKLLELNTDNRKLRKAKVDEYVRAMQRGDFHFNGDAIRISEPNADGQCVLLDGQHRLEALKLMPADYGILALVIDGLPSISRETIDVGATRTAANLLEFGGAERTLNATNIAALGRAAMTMEDPKQSMPSKQEVVHYVKAHEDDLERAYLHGHRTIENAPLKGGTTPYALAAYLIGQVESDDEAIRYFFRKLSTGEGLFSGDPIMTLRNRLISHPPTTEGGSRSRYRRNSSLFLRAWNAFATGQKLTSSGLRVWNEGQPWPAPKKLTPKARQRIGRLMAADAAGAVMTPVFIDELTDEVDKSSTNRVA
jgi:hypothetical protein